MKKNQNESYTVFDPVFSPTTLDGMSNERARNFVRKIATGAYHGGMYTDDHWEGPNNIKKAFNEVGIEHDILSADYHNWPPIDSAKASYKKWKLRFPFVNKTGRETLLHGTIIAAGGGRVEDPLERYDTNFTVFEENKQTRNENMKNQRLNMLFQTLQKRFGTQENIEVIDGKDGEGEFIALSANGKNVKVGHNGRNFIVNGEELTPQAIVPSSKKPFLKHAMDTLQIAENGTPLKNFVRNKLEKLKKIEILKEEKKRIILEFFPKMGSNETGVSIDHFNSMVDIIQNPDLKQYVQSIADTNKCTQNGYICIPDEKMREIKKYISDENLYSNNPRTSQQNIG